MKNLLLVSLLFCLGKSSLQAQSPQAGAWADSVLNTLSPDERIAQLMVVRAHSNLGADHVKQVTELVEKYNIGGLCFFQGGPVRQANLTNFYQSIAKTPLMICIDGEWGLGMRLDSVINFPRQLMLGAVNDPKVVYEYGKAIGEQCKRLGIHVNYAPVVDINNNPANPVINDRSFGEDKYKVALYGIQYMKGMQDVGVMGCAKHFPGHGDVAVDSHYDLPVINKTMAELDSLELYPFRKIFEAGVGSVMIAHLFIPSIDNTANQPTSLSYKNVTELLRKDLGYQGISFTDALEMKGVAKFYPAGEASVQSLIAGNDMLCLPGDIPGSIRLVKRAIRRRDLSWKEINARVKKVLIAKYESGLNAFKPIDTKGLTEDLNKHTARIQQLIADHALTLVRDESKKIPLKMDARKKVAYVGVGISGENIFSEQMKAEYNADVFYFNYKQDLTRVATLTDLLKDKYDEVIIGVHQFSRRPANNFGISAPAMELVRALNKETNPITIVFGNPYAIGFFPEAKTLITTYEDDEVTQKTATAILLGKKEAQGTLPVTVAPQLLYGTGVTDYLSTLINGNGGMDIEKLQGVKTIVEQAIYNGATPGGVVLASRNGQIVYEEAFGYDDYSNQHPVTKETIYDLASVTKIAATTVSIMKLYEEGKINLKKTLGDYLPSVAGTDKANLVMEDILLHQAGLRSYIPFYRETLDSVSGIPKPGFYNTHSDSIYTVPVADTMFLRTDWVDTIYQRILTSPLGPSGNYVYSDNDFIFLGKVVEQISGMPLQEYVQRHFYVPLGMETTGFRPYERFPISAVAPTEKEPYFRLQQIRGYVHDPGAALMGNVAGHAGLFSNARDLWKLFQMLLDGGVWEGKRYFKKETIDLFTSYGTAVSRRALGFDKPEKDNATRKEPYPAASVSPFTFGHTGFTGTCVWVDPAEKMVYIFLSNRVCPDGNNPKLLRMNVRGQVHDLLYQSLIRE